MGNSQSQSGADAYEAGQSERAQGYGSRNDHNNHEAHKRRPSNQSHHKSYSNGAILEEHDDSEYARLRGLARDEAQRRNDCFEASQVAYRSKEGARAKELSNEGKKHDTLMKLYNQRAADLVYRQKNDHRPPTEIDLHGLFVKEASEKVEEALERCKQMKLDHLVIIVGKGLHSPGQIAKLKPAIVELINKYQVSVQPDRPNPGCLYVEFGKGPSELSWLDRWFGTDRDGCVIM